MHRNGSGPIQQAPMQIAAPLNDLQFAGLLAAILVTREDGPEDAERFALAAKRASHLMLHVAFEAAVGSFGGAIDAGFAQGKARLEQLEMERRAALEQQPAEPPPLRG